MIQNIPFILATIMIVPGILMAWIPVLPALPYMFIVSLVFALYGGFTSISVVEIAFLAGVVCVSILLDHLSGVLGAKYGGAHTKSLLWGIVGVIVGTLFFPLFGGFIGLFIAILISELYYKRSQEHALKAAGSALIGKIVGVLLNVFLAVLFVGLFVYFGVK